jgi:hypothetical protein
MRIEQRWTMSEDHTRRILRGLVLVAESESESKMLDEAFGTEVLDDGLIDSRERVVECRLADGYGEHYIHINLLAATSTTRKA